jgi:hypothetical protein
MGFGRSAIAKIPTAKTVRRSLAVNLTRPRRRERTRERKRSSRGTAAVSSGVRHAARRRASSACKQTRSSKREIRLMSACEKTHSIVAEENRRHRIGVDPAVEKRLGLGGVRAIPRGVRRGVRDTASVESEGEPNDAKLRGQRSEVGDPVGHGLRNALYRRINRKADSQRSMIFDSFSSFFSGTAIDATTGGWANRCVDDREFRVPPAGAFLGGSERR